MATKKDQVQQPQAQQTIPILSIDGNKVLGSLYSQAVGVVVTDTDITLDFVYIHPRPPVNGGSVVARVTLPRVVGEGLAKDINNTVILHESGKKKGDKNGSN